MFAQLGSQIFEGLLSPETLSKEDTTTYAQHDLIKNKPRLQPIANDLVEMTIDLKLRAEFCNVKNVVGNFKKSKDTFEVLPYVLGTGEYVGDFVITSIKETHNVCLADGFLVEAALSITLKEYKVVDNLKLLQQSARDRAFALGNKQPINKAVDSAGLSIKNTPTCNQQVVQQLTIIKGKANYIGINMPAYEATTNENKLKQVIREFSECVKTIMSELNALYTFKGPCVANNAEFYASAKLAYTEGVKLNEGYLKSYPDPVNATIKNAIIAQTSALFSALGKLYAACSSITSSVIVRKP